MKALLASSALLGTIIVTIGIGVGVGYASICGILNAFGRRREKAQAAQLAHTVGD